METWIPALGACVARMNGGALKLAERLEQKLEDGSLLCWDMPIGPKQTRPDFMVLHPRRGWRLEIIRTTTRHRFEIASDRLFKVVMSPLQQAWHSSLKVTDALVRARKNFRLKTAGCYASGWTSIVKSNLPATRSNFLGRLIAWFETCSGRWISSDDDRISCCGP